MKILVALLSLSLACLALAQTAGDAKQIMTEEGLFEYIITTKGKRFDQVKVIEADAAFVKFTHRDGVARVAMEEMPVKVKLLYDWNPDDAREALEEARQQQARDAEARRVWRENRAAASVEEAVRTERLMDIHRKGFVGHLVILEPSSRGTKVTLRAVLEAPVKGKYKGDGSPVIGTVISRITNEVKVLGLSGVTVGQVMFKTLYPAGGKPGAEVYATTAEQALEWQMKQPQK